MSKSTALLDEVKAAKGIESMNGLAKEAKLTYNTVWRIYTEGKTLDDYAAARIAKQLGYDERAIEKVVFAIKAERAKSADEKRFWKAHAGFADVAALAGIAGFSILVLIFREHLISVLPFIHYAQDEECSEGPVLLAA